MPWGEFTPRVFRAFGRTVADEFAAGGASPTFACPAGRIAPLICNDVCFSRVMRKYDSPDVFVVSSCEEADGTGALQTSMDEIVRLRAVELRKTIVINAHRGYSGAVSGDGRILYRIDDTAHALERETFARMDRIPLDKRFSPYRVYGDWPMLCGFLLAAFMGVHRWLRRGARAPPLCRP